jgi:serine protease Do
MNTIDIIEQFENVIIHIATPYCTGTGIYLKTYDLIVTNEHVVRGNKTAVVAGLTFDKQIVDVLYMDSKYDLAFLKAPYGHQMSEVGLNIEKTLETEAQVIALGYPFDLHNNIARGTTSKHVHNEEDINYIQHDAVLNPGDSGGPLVDTNGMVIGINTFIIQNGNSVGFSLPIHYLISCIDAFKTDNGSKGVRCFSCENIQFESKGITYKYCSFCGASITMLSQIAEYQPYGVSSTVEEMISTLGYSVGLTRKGPNNWSLKKGSATLNISYYEKTGLLVGDVYLCTLPENNVTALYHFLLRQNYQLQGMNFSIRDQDIILSLLIYDQYINSETMLKLFRSLLDTADAYDNILVEKYEAKWKVQKQ